MAGTVLLIAFFVDARDQARLQEESKKGGGTMLALHRLCKEHRRVCKGLEWSRPRLDALVRLSLFMRAPLDGLTCLWLEGAGRLQDLLQAQRDWASAIRSAWETRVWMGTVTEAFVSASIKGTAQ